VARPIPISCKDIQAIRRRSGFRPRDDLRSREPGGAAGRTRFPVARVCAVGPTLPPLFDFLHVLSKEELMRAGHGPAVADEHVQHSLESSYAYIILTWR
jgi:hypothetical protein